MTALQIASDNCANLDAGKCLGLEIADNLKTVGSRPKPKCVLGTPGIRCTYFEQCVAVRPESIFNPTPARMAAFKEALHKYRRAANVPTDTARCETCPRLVETGRRFCPVCAENRRRARQRQYAQGKRDAASTNGVSKPVEKRGVLKAFSSGLIDGSGHPKTDDQNALAESRAAA